MTTNALIRLSTRYLLDVPISYRDIVIPTGRWKIRVTNRDKVDLFLEVTVEEINYVGLFSKRVTTEKTFWEHENNLEVISTEEFINGCSKG